MKKITYLKTMLVAIALIVGSAGISAQVVISQIYGGGGNSGATLKNDFIELYNRGTSPVSLNGWSVQYTSATGSVTSWTAANSTNLPNVTLNSGQYYLIQEAAGTGGTASTVTADLTGTIGLSGTAGKLALCNSTTLLTTADFTLTAPSGGSIVDFVGFGSSATQYEGTAPAPAPSNTTAIFRNSGGLVDTNNNSADFTTGTPNPRNTSNYQSTSSSAPVTFSIPATGLYFSTQNVTLSSITPSAKIYYTIDNSDPSSSTTLYSGAITVSTTTTIKAIAYDASNANPSSITNVTLTFPSFTEVADIATLKAGLKDGTTIYKLSGQAVLTYKSASRNAKYIQDATGAVLIDDAGGKITTLYNLYDGITGIFGTLADYSGMLQFTPVANPGVATSTNNPIVPAEVGLSEMINNPGKLVIVKNVTVSDITSGTGKFVASTNYNLNSSSSTIIRTQYYDLPYIGATIPTSAQNITGVVLINSTTAQLVPRTAADFSGGLTTGLSSLATNLNVSASNGNVVFSATAGQTVEIYNSVGQKLLQKQAVSGLNIVPVSAKGVLLVKVDNRIAKVII